MTTAQEQMETVVAQTQVLNSALERLLINLVSDPFPPSLFPDPIPLLTLSHLPLHLLEGSGRGNTPGTLPRLAI